MYYFPGVAAVLMVKSCTVFWAFSNAVLPTFVTAFLPTFCGLIQFLCGLLTDRDHGVDDTGATLNPLAMIEPGTMLNPVPA